MTKFVIKTLIISIILIGIGFYVYYLKTGNMTNSVIQEPNISDLNLSKITSSATNLLNLKRNESSDTKYLYKWRNSKGIIHYTSEKPAADIAVETIELSSDTNIVPAVTEANINQTDPQSQLPQNENTAESNANLYLPQGLEQLFDQADSVKNLINEHYSEDSTQENQK